MVVRVTDTNHALDYVKNYASSVLLRLPIDTEPLLDASVLCLNQVDGEGVGSRLTF